MRDGSGAFRRALLAAGHEARQADKWAATAAGHWTLLHDALATDGQLQALLERMGLGRPEAVQPDSDSERCLRVLLDARMPVVEADGGREARHPATLAALLRRLGRGESGDAPALAKQLEPYGVRALAGSGKLRLAAASGADHARLGSVFRGIDWALGGWRAVLLRLPAASEGVQRIDGIPRRCVIVDVPEYLSDEDDRADRMAAESETTE